MSLVKAAQNGNIILVKKLLDDGADPNIQTTFGNSALMRASKYGRTDIIELLTHHINIIKIQSRFRGKITRRITRTQKAYQQIYTSLLPIDFDVSSMIGKYLSRMPYNPEVAKRMK